ncbi:MAG: hypothetical protein ACI4JG_09375 [Acutalibacteraceae bacterium]
MKTYAYKKSAYFIQLFFVLGLIALLLLFEYKFNSSRFLNRCVFLAIFLVICIPFAVSVFRKKVILNDESICFISFFNSFYIPKNQRDFSVKYSDIKSIEFKKSFIQKRKSLKIKANNRTNNIYIEYNMVNHKELFKNLCELVKQQNPNASIDESIFDYCHFA